MEIKKVKVPNEKEYTYMPDYSLDDHEETIYMDDFGKEVPEDKATHGITRVYDSNGELLREEFIFIDHFENELSDEGYKWPDF